MTYYQGFILADLNKAGFLPEIQGLHFGVDQNQQA
jgi:hypothetical protein